MRTVVYFLYALVVFAYAYDEIDEYNEESNKHVKPVQWAVLVAGSDGWWNYRHQADMCHAYHILLKRGVPASNIIVFMKDDIAYNTENPVKGQIINKPNGTDVYKGVKIDYKGKDVTPKNFLNVLLGKKEALKGIGSGKVLESGPKDNVFVNFADHGGTGILCFPDDDLSASDLISTLNKMSANKRYGKMLLYIEACEAGSMFQSLISTNKKILASTASANDETSWGYYCQYENYPCLGDLYSISWMNHMDTQIPEKETIFDQYQKVRNWTFMSHVNLYGDFRVGRYYISEFFGFKSAESSQTLQARSRAEPIKKHESVVSSREIPLYWMKRMAKNAANKRDSMKFERMILENEQKRELIDELFEKIIKEISFDDEFLKKEIEDKHPILELDMLSCYTDLYRYFSKNCVNLPKNPYVLEHVYKFANICKMDVVFQQKTIASINKLCHPKMPKFMNTF